MSVELLRPEPDLAPVAPPTRRSPPRIAVELGGMLRMTVRAAKAGTSRPLDYGPEFVEQLRFTLQACFFPMVLTSFALSFGPAGIQASSFFELFGSLDRLGGAYSVITVRMFAPLVVAIVLAGVAGTAICADLGARRVREEIDALEVLGVDPVKQLIVPRFLALLVTAVLFNIFAIASGLLGALLVLKQSSAPVGPFWSSFLSNATTLELAASFVKCAVYGSMVAVVCCFKGTAASGGSRGVGRAVNEAVVICFLSIGFIDYVFTQLLLATHPSLSQVRG